MKPFIGITPLWDNAKNSYWMLPDYMKAIEDNGGIPIILPLTTDAEAIKEMALRFDGFLFTGGHDIDPIYYQEEKLPACAELCPPRDAMESLLFKEVYQTGKPILGICRGLQLINIMLGGTLYQDLATQYDVKATHRMEAPYNRSIHKINILPDTCFAQMIPCSELGVNSCHHQAIKDLAPTLTASALSEDGLIEAVYEANHTFLAATQWHPEMALDADMYSANIFQAFLSACRAN